MDNKWEEYYNHTKETKPHKNIEKFLNLGVTPGKAIDLGCGAGRDTIALIKNNWRVLAVDKENTENIEYQRNYLVFVFKETFQGYDYSTHQDVEKTRYMYYYTNFDSSYDSDDEYMGESRLYNDSFDYVENEADVLTSLQKQSIADYGNSKVEEVTIPVS